MDTGDLYNAGWRQGSVFLADLSAPSLDVGAGQDEMAIRSLTHGCWVVCAQDCDLRSSPLDAPTVRIEIRPVFAVDPPTAWGSRRSPPKSSLRMTSPPRWPPCPMTGPFGWRMKAAPLAA